MVELPLKQGIPRLKANEDRFNTFINGSKLQGYVTPGGESVPSVLAYLELTRGTIRDQIVEYIDEDMNGLVAETGANATAAAVARAGSEAAKVDSQASASLSMETSEAAIAAAEAIGDVVFFDTYAAAAAAVGSMVDQQIVEIFGDETSGGMRARYRLQGGTLVRKLVFFNRITPEQFGAKPGATVECTSAVQAAIDYIASLPFGGEVIFPSKYLVDKIVMKPNVSLRGLSKYCGLKWREQAPPDLFTAAAVVSVTKDSKTVTITGDVTAQVQKGRIFRLDGSSAIYVVADISYADPNTVITLNRPFFGATAAAQTAVFNSPYGMLEWPTGRITADNIACMTFDGAASNPGGFVVYRAAAKGGQTSGGDWNSLWYDVRISNCHNGAWFRGTTTAPYSNSVEPIQFTDFYQPIIERASNTDGSNLWITGQVNQQTFYAPLFQALNGADNHKGIVIFMDQEPLGTISGTSNKSPQGIRFMHPSIQGAEYGWLSYAGETVELYRPYFEHLPKVVTVFGYNLSNQLEMLITMPEFKGGMGTMVAGYTEVDPDPGYLFKTGASARITAIGGHMKTNSLNIWKNAGGELVWLGNPLLVQGVGGLTTGRMDQRVVDKTLVGGVLDLGSEEAIELTHSGPFSTLQSDLWPGKQLTIFVTNVNGLIIDNTGNLRLPGGRARWRLNQGAILTCVRSDVPNQVGWIVTKVQAPRALVQRGVNFELPETYLYNRVQITGSCICTLPSDATAPGFAIGDEIEFLFTGGQTFGFAAGDSAIVRGVNDVLDTDRVYTRAIATKYAANTWLVTFDYQKAIQPVITDRGANFTLPNTYRKRLIRITATCIVTLPTDAADTGILVGDEFDFLFIAGLTLTFAGASGVTVNSKGGALSTNVVYTRAKALKHAANTWLISFF